ncbi:hypothetical protein V1264_014250 [Littorina saxatilis]|uniref:Peroxidase n=1 Tax=Littorina saxatilis TaxID=31220 RepID=A0AAN9BQ03_9CAEN
MHPALSGLGKDESLYSYNRERSPQIANVFASAAFRFGHTLVPASVMWGNERIPLHKAFSNPKWVRQDVDKVLQGLLQVSSQIRDQFFVTGLRNRLFESAPRRGLDLIALNIQRGRDHGLLPYNAWRETCGLPTIHGFNDSALGSAGPSLQEVYLSVDDIDLFTGATSEPSLSGAIVGPTLACLIGKQFADLKNADRFFYQTAGQEGFTHEQLQVIGQTSMAGLLCSNTERLTTVQQNPFFKASNL